MQKLLTFFSKNNIVYAIFNDRSFNDTLNYNIVSFEQLGPSVSIPLMMKLCLSLCLVSVHGLFY